MRSDVENIAWHLYPDDEQTPETRQRAHEQLDALVAEVERLTRDSSLAAFEGMQRQAKHYKAEAERLREDTAVLLRAYYDPNWSETRECAEAAARLRDVLASAGGDTACTESVAKSTPQTDNVGESMQAADPEPRCPWCDLLLRLTCPVHGEA